MTALHVVEPGASALLQDLGRPGHAHLGVPRSGALDPAAVRLANRLVGNAEHAVAVEVLVGGLRCMFDSPVTVALTGALQLRVDGRDAAWGEAVGVAAGADVEVRPGSAGVRGWLAVSGGLLPALELGSGASDTLSGLGPPPLQSGSVVGVGPSHGLVPGGSAVPQGDTQVCRLRVAPGPRRGWFTDAAWDGLLSEQYVVTPDSDRIAVRLDGPDLPRTSARTGTELDSEGIVLGAVQVPASGRPLIFGADHPTTGGYPVIAVVHAEDLGRCAQLAPGSPVQFTAGH